jgi:NADH-quinone oxidoreductase subunit J
MKHEAIIMNLLFLATATVAVGTSIAAITRHNVLHSILYLIVSFAAIAVVFYLLGAPFIAALEIITYAGAIMVLFLFAVMLLNLGGSAIEQERRWQPVLSWAGPAFAGLVLLAEFLFILMHDTTVNAANPVITPAQVGRALFLRYTVGVELVAMLLLSALLGASRLGRRPRTYILKQGIDHDSHSV